MHLYGSLTCICSVKFIYFFFTYLITFNSFEFFKSHRKNLIISLANSGKKIAVITNLEGVDLEEIGQLERLNIFFFNYKLDRSSLGLFSNLIDFFRLYRILIKIRAEKLNLISSKPIILGGICSYFLSLNKVFFTISGLGYIFISKSLKARVFKRVILFMYKILFRKKNIKVIFQNKDDLNYFVERKVLNKQKSLLIRGNGINLKKFKRVDFPQKLTFLFASRLLIDKGVLEFVEAASRFDKTNCSFLLAGDIDIDNPNSLRESKLNEIKKFQYIEYLGKISHSDMAELFNKASVFVLPSYREGLPQAALEAGACSMPLILTDVNGCRDCLIDNETGFLIREKNVDSLVNKINLFVCNPDLVVQMGNRSKEYIRDNFSEEKVHNQFHEIY